MEKELDVEEEGSKRTEKQTKEGADAVRETENIDEEGGGWDG